jgi:hypothetical protein
VTRKRKLYTVFSIVTLLGALLIGAAVHHAHAQFGVGTVVGATTPVNQFQNSSATGLAGAVTNPASNFIVQVAGGPIYFGGVISDIAQAQLTLPANSTNLIVFSGFGQQVYAKQAVTGPGSSGTSVGIPTSLLFADSTRGEIPLATVVCNATACGNGGNGSITDNRPLSAFPAGIYLGGHMNQAVAGTAAATSMAGSGTLSGGTLAVTFSNAFQAAPVCVANDTTAANAVKTATTTTTLTLTGTTTDTVAWACFGNPN